MASDELDIKPDKIPAEDRREAPPLIEPLLVQEGARDRGELGGLALELTARSTGFSRSLPDGVVNALSELARYMNCYYSNLIEGHDTHPVDIERSLNED